MIPREVIDEIRSRSDIVELISEYVTLKRMRKNYVAICPFHQEKIPSFTVSPEKQIFYCFGCGAGGNAISFLMKMEGLSFPEAIRLMARKMGIALPQTSGPEIEEREVLYQIHEFAANYYHKILLHAPDARMARDYVHHRAFKEETVEKFRLGYAPLSWDSLFRTMVKEGYSSSLLEKAGLIIPRQEEGGYYDRFRHRLLFPIRDVGGRVIAFGGRTLDESLPKYLNSPETLIYSKGKCLYALETAREGLRREKKAIVVEGYTDALALHQEGIVNTVASLGTALTDSQAQLLRRYVEEAILIYDVDTAGVAATLRGLDVLVEADLKVKIVTLTSAKDPDEFIKLKGGEEFRRLLSGAQNLVDYKINLIGLQTPERSIERKEQIIRELIPTLAKMPRLARSEYQRILAEKLRIDENLLEIEMRKQLATTGKVLPLPVVEEEWVLASWERNFLTVLMTDENCLRRVKQELSLDNVMNPEVKKVLTILYRLMDQKEPVDPGRVLMEVEEEKIRKALTRGLMLSIEEEMNREKVVEGSLRKIKFQSLEWRKNQLQVEINEAERKGDTAKLYELLLEKQKIIRELNSDIINL